MLGAIFLFVVVLPRLVKRDKAVKILGQVPYPGTNPVDLDLPNPATGKNHHGITDRFISYK